MYPIEAFPSASTNHAWFYFLFIYMCTYFLGCRPSVSFLVGFLDEAFSYNSKLFFTLRWWVCADVYLFGFNSSSLNQGWFQPSESIFALFVVDSRMIFTSPSWSLSSGDLAGHHHFALFAIKIIIRDNPSVLCLAPKPCKSAHPFGLTTVRKKKSSSPKQVYYTSNYFISQKL